MNVQIEDSWKAHLQPEFDKDYFYTSDYFGDGMQKGGKSIRGI